MNIGSDSTPLSVAAGDFTGDGNLDLGVLSRVFVVDCTNPDNPDEFNGYWEGRATVLRGDGTGSFAAPIVSALGSGYFTDAAVADFDGDGRDDFAATDNYATLGVFLAKSDGSGNLLASATYTTGVYLQSVLVADVNDDGIDDLVTGNGGSVSVLLGNGSAGIGDGTFQAARTTALDFYTTSLAVGDFNADGDLDLSATNNVFVIDYTNPSDPDDYYGHYEGQVKVLLGDGTGRFAAPETTELGVGYQFGIVSGHFGRDAFADLAVTNTNPNVFLPNNVSVLLDDQSLPPPPPPPPPSVSINDVTVTEGNTGTRTATFTVTLSAAFSQSVTVAYGTTNGTATAGSDYQGTSGPLTIPAGQTTGTVTVLVNGDRLAGPNETFSVNLSNPINATVADGQGVGTIVDDEPRISVSDVSKKDGNGKKTAAFVFTVTLSAAYDRAVTMSFKTTDGTATTGDNDYVAQIGTVTFKPDETSKTITIEVKGDSKKESTEYFYLDLFGNSGNSLFTKSRGTGTILNDD